jgi:hypothetical protein
VTSSRPGGVYSTRRSWLHAIAASATIPHVPAPSPIASAVATYREASDAFRRQFARCESAGRAWGDHPPGTVEHSRLLRAERDLMRSAFAELEAAESVLSALADASLSACVHGPDLFVVADLEPEGVRRLVVVPSHRLARS